MLLSRLSQTLKVPLLALLAAVLLLLPNHAAAKGTLPKPYVSRSLDVVLLPVTDAVRKEFKLGKKAAGAVVASVEPGGTGEFFGIQPGDVISQVEGKHIRRPVDVDSILRYGLGKDESFFFLDGVRKNHRLRTWVQLSQEDYEKPVALDKVKAWRAYGGRKSRQSPNYFYYADYCDYYYDDFYYVWDYSYTYIEEIIITEVYITSIESSEAVFYYDESALGYDWPDDDYISEVDDFVYSDEFAEAYYSEDVSYEDENYDPETGLSYDDAAALGYLDDAQGTEEPVYPASDEPSIDENYVDSSNTDEPYVEEPYLEEPYVEEPVYEEPVYEEPVYEEPVYEEPVYEEPVYEEPVYEEPVYEEPVYEEPVYEEPVYEEPVYEEPVYEEPAYDGGGGGCSYDDYGNEIC